MKKVINPELIVFPEKEELNKVLLFCMEQSIDWEQFFELKPDDYRVSQIILAKLSGMNYINTLKNENGSTHYDLLLPLYTQPKSLEFDIEEFYDLFSNKNLLGKPLGRKTNKSQVITDMTKFLMDNPKFSYSKVVEQTRLWIAEKVKTNSVEYVPKAENFIYKRDKFSGKITGSPLLDLLNDPIQTNKYGLL